MVKCIPNFKDLDDFSQSEWKNSRVLLAADFFCILIAKNMLFIIKTTTTFVPHFLPNLGIVLGS